MRIAVCDDEKIFREQVRDAVEDFYGKLEVTCSLYEDGAKLLDAFRQGEGFDALFLDIEMPELDGMQTAQLLRKEGCSAPVIFLTSHTEFAMDGYEVAAFRFLAKPVAAEKLQKTLLDLKAQLLEGKKLMFLCDGEEVVLDVRDICYAEAMNNSVRIVHTGGEYVVRRKISDLEEELSGLSDLFFRIHRGYLVSLAHVKKQKGNDVYVTGGSVLPLSRPAVKPFKERLLGYIRSSAR